MTRFFNRRSRGRLAAFALAGLAANAPAAVFYHSVTVPSQAVGWTNSVSLPQFNMPDEELYSVQIRIVGALGGQVGVENLEDKFNLIYATLSGGHIVLDWTNQTVLTLNLAGTGSVVTSPFDGNINYGGPSGYTFMNLAPTGQASTAYSYGNLASFIGTGSLWYTISTWDDSSATAGIGTPAFFSDLDGSAYFEIRYETVVIPEPSTLATLVFMATFCLIAHQRRRRSSRLDVGRRHGRRLP